MAFDLTKNDGSTPKVDLSKKPISKFNLTKEGTPTVTETPIVGGNGKNGGSKKGIFILIAIVVVGIAAWLLFSKSPETVSAPEVTTVPVDSTSIKPQDTADSIALANADEAQVSSNEVATTEAAPTPVQAQKALDKVVVGNQKAENSSQDATTQVSTLPQGTIEEKAKQVIRGDFGNGIERKKALGDEYKEIQKRVNELYRNGKI